jgi:hypothetical protein
MARCPGGLFQLAPFGLEGRDLNASLQACP